MTVAIGCPVAGLYETSFGPAGSAIQPSAPVQAPGLTSASDSFSSRLFMRGPWRVNRRVTRAVQSSRMADFLPFVRRWFDATFAEATRPQREGWPAIASGHDTLIVAPTGSGKTLAAFLWALDHLHRLGLDRRLEDRVHVVYVSPLRALNNDIEKNLRAPLADVVDLPFDEAVDLLELFALAEEIPEDAIR